MTIRNLDDLLSPASVAVIGASNRERSVGCTVMANLRRSFEGPLFPVNPKHKEVAGVRAFRKIEQLPQVPRLAVICTPPPTVPGLIAQLGRFGTRAAVVMTAGLTKEQKQAALDAARPHLLRILGPNCIGLMTPRIGLNASFAHANASPGELALVSQSGALVTAMLDWANARRIGFSHLISLGERADVDFGDLLDVLASDAGTRAILLYVESIEAPRKFMSAARAAARNKPVIVVKAGRSGEGVKAAASHTGAMAGSDLVYDAAINRAGMLRVATLQELLTAAQTLARFRRNTSETMTIITNGGGGGVLAADAAAAAGVPLYEPDDAMIERLDGLLPSTWSRGNPIDVIGDAPVERYTSTLAALLQEPKTGAILFMHAPTAIVDSEDIARACAPLAAQHPDRLTGCWLGEEAVAAARRIFEDAGIPNFETPEEAVGAFAMLRTYRRNQETLLQAPVAAECKAPDEAAARALIERALADKREWLTEIEAKDMLRAYGVPVVPTVGTAPEPDAAVAAARELGYPAALKIVSHDITHKSEVGGVRLDLNDDNEVRSAAVSMLARVRERQPQARIEAFSVQSMVARRNSHELIVGASIDPVFGPVILFGHGGTAAEVVADRAVALPPLNRPLAAELISRTRVARLLGGYRDRPPAESEAVQDVLVAVSRMLADLPEIAELDINPLTADDKGVVALDARVRLHPGRPGGAEHFAIRPYPAELVERVQWQGRPLVLRPIRPEDEAQHLEFFERLDREDVRMRVFHSRRELPRNELARLTQIDYAREMAFIAEGASEDGKPETLGVVRAVSDPDHVKAEFAIIVRSDMKGRGLGQLLLDKMIRYAGASGLKRLVAVVLRENRAMQELARANGLAIDREASASDPDAVHFVLELRGGEGAGAQ